MAQRAALVSCTCVSAESPVAQITPGAPTSARSRRPRRCAGRHMCGRRHRADQHARLTRRSSNSASRLSRRSIAEMKAAGPLIASTRPSIPTALRRRLGNTVMLGAIADHLPFSADVLLAAILNRSPGSEKVLDDQLGRPSPARRGRCRVRPEKSGPARSGVKHFR